MAGFPCTALRGVDIVVASAAQEAEDRIDLRSLSASVPRGQCDPDGRTIGSLVLTPSGSRAAVTVVARVVDGAPCTKATNFKGCIVSRRTFAFIEHAALTLPITLEPSCVDVPCDVKTSCRAGTCVDANADCSEQSGNCISPAEPGSTGGPAPDGDAGPDGSTSDAPTDGPVQDAPIDGAGDSGGDGGVVGNPGAASNLCFTGMMPPPTFGSGNQCCCPMAGGSCMILTAPLACGGNGFGCTGRLHCGSGYCCGSESSVAGACMDPCTVYLCGFDDDCPPDMVCRDAYYTVASGTFRKCVKK